jgi:hypothetical protein
MNIIPFILFPVFLIPTVVMVRKVFRHGEFLYAGYVMALVSALTTALLLGNPVGFFDMVLSGGVFAAFMVIMFACFCLIPVGAFFFMLFAGLRHRFRMDAIRHHFEPLIPENHVHEHWVPERRRRRNTNGLEISDVGRQQIARLIRTQKKDDEEEKEEHGYINISSEYGDE